MNRTILVRGARQLLTLHGPTGPRRGDALRELGVIEDGSLLITNGVISSVGPTRRIENLSKARSAEEINAAGRVVMPCFNDPHVALPSEVVPLHIFEERYKAMIARCLEEESEFGIVWLADDGLRPIGCACEVTEILERMPDGRVNLLARGTRPFRIEQRQDDLAYPAGVVEFLVDRDEPYDSEAADSAHGAYTELVLQATDKAPDPEAIGALTAYEMAATVEFGLEAKQGLLDLRSESARMKLVARLCRAAIKRLDFVDRAQARAQSNGKVHFTG